MRFQAGDSKWNFCWEIAKHLIFTPFSNYIDKILLQWSTKDTLCYKLSYELQQFEERFLRLVPNSNLNIPDSMHDAILI